MANRMVDSARSILNRYLPDVYIYTDVARGGGKDRYVCNYSSSIVQLHILNQYISCDSVSLSL